MHRAQHALEVLPENAPLYVRAALWLVIAQTSNTLYLTPQALEAGQRAHEAFDALADEPHLAYAWQSVGFSLARAGIHEDAERALTHAQELAERQGNRRLFMRALLRRAQNI
jgi:tetratricopeptide (TPR) repeat protein